LLIEIIASKNGPIDDRTVARVIERLYEIDVKPDWWKLESQPNKTAWDAIARAIETGDPLCRGVLLLGLEAPEKDLAQAFALAHNCAVVKGFAVGRTIFAEPAAEWFAGRIDDREAVERMAAAFQRLSDRWREGERTMREATIAPSSSKKH
jgi:5-dehydro-2-deoxygluconokinase